LSAPGPRHRSSEKLRGTLPRYRRPVDMVSRPSNETSNTQWPRSYEPFRSRQHHGSYLSCRYPSVPGLRLPSPPRGSVGFRCRADPAVPSDRGGPPRPDRWNNEAGRRIADHYLDRQVLILIRSVVIIDLGTWLSPAGSSLKYPAVPGAHQDLQSGSGTKRTAPILTRRGATPSMRAPQS
jgi:hypothetical protein